MRANYNDYTEDIRETMEYLELFLQGDTLRDCISLYKRDKQTTEQIRLPNDMASTVNHIAFSASINERVPLQ